jgi:hypothetical protein
MKAEHAREAGLFANGDEAANRIIILHLQLVKKTKETISPIILCLRVENNSVCKAFGLFVFLVHFLTRHRAAKMTLHIKMLSMQSCLDLTIHSVSSLDSMKRDRHDGNNMAQKSR